MRTFVLVCLALATTGVGCTPGRSMSAERKSTNGGQSEQVFRKRIPNVVGLKYLRYLPKGFRDQKNRKLEYLLYLPKGYDEQTEQKWPLLMFLHGGAEWGNNINRVKKNALPKLIEQGQDFPFIIISPQCPGGYWWTEKIDALTSLLDEVQSKYAVDPEQVYLTGVSMGGFGTWALACRHPERFAAIAPICGGGDWDLAYRLKTVPVWAFHGARDPVVALQESTEMVDSLKRAGGDVQLTVYPEAEHDSWTVTYNNPKLYEWFLSHRTHSEE